MKIWKTSRIPFVALLLTAAITPIALAQATLADEPLKADISGTWIAKLASRMGELEIVYRESRTAVWRFPDRRWRDHGKHFSLHCCVGYVGQRPNARGDGEGC
jgi:hypothetical protein